MLETTNQANPSFLFVIWGGIKDPLSFLGNISSIIGFAFTVYIFSKARQISSFYTFKMRVPNLCEKLVSEQSELSKLLKDADQYLINEVRIVVARIIAILTSLRKHDVTHKYIDVIINPSFNLQCETREEVWGFYTKIVTIVEVVKELIADNALERQ